MQIAERREELGLTQSELSEISGLSIWTIRSYEQGTRDINCMELKKAIALATALELSVYDLIT